MNLSGNILAKRLSMNTVKRLSTRSAKWVVGQFEFRPLVSRIMKFKLAHYPKWLFAGRLLLVTLGCSFLFAGTAKCQIQGAGPLDQLRQDFITKSQAHTFQVSQIQVTGKIVSVDASRKEIFRQLMIKNPASREKLGEYVKSVILDDGQSQTKAACSAFEKDRQRETSLLDSAVQLSPGETITVSGTFLGAYQAGAVELLNCSLVTKNSAMSSSGTNPAQTTPLQNQSSPQSRGVTTA